MIRLFRPLHSSRTAPPLPWSPPSAGRTASCCFTPSHSGPASWRSPHSRGSSTKPNRAWVGEPKGWGPECDTVGQDLEENPELSTMCEVFLKVKLPRWNSGLSGVRAQSLGWMRRNKFFLASRGLVQTVFYCCHFSFRYLNTVKDSSSIIWTSQLVISRY